MVDPPHDESTAGSPESRVVLIAEGNDERRELLVRTLELFGYRLLKSPASQG